MSGSASLLNDFRVAMRRLRHRPGFSTVVIATIALALGANTAMFTFVRGLLLRPLPYPDADRIVRVLERLPSGGLNGASTLNYLDWTNQNTVFEYIAAEAGWSATLGGGSEPTLVRGARVSAHYFDIFGTRPALGRTFRSGDDLAGSDRIVLVSHALWQSRFASDPGLIGRDILLDAEPYTVVGVLPADGPFDRAAAQIWSPLAFQPPAMTRDFRWLGASAKLKAGVTLAQARAEMDVIARRVASAHPDSNKDWGVAVDRLSDVLIGPQMRTAVVVLFAATAFVLLIGCANLASLALAHGVSRQGERAVRAALGAGRWRLLQQLLVENLVLSLCGGLGGVGVGYVILTWIRSLIPPSALPPAADIGMDATVVLFTLTVAVVTGLLFGAAPAVHIRAPGLIRALNEGGHGTTPAIPSRRLYGGLVVAQIALAFVLLAGSGLLMRSVLNLLAVDPGFAATNVLTARLPIRQQQHADPAELNAYLDSIRGAVNAVPGVRETALTSALPLEGWGYGVPYVIAGRPVPERVNRRPAFFKIVSSSYFNVLGIRLVAGRVLAATDRAGGAPVTVINDVLARREFPAEDPIGRRIVVRAPQLGKAQFGAEIAWEVVGVIASERINGLGDEASAGMYVSHQQSPTYGLNLVVGSLLPPQSLETAVQSAVRRVNRDQVLSDVRPMQQIVDRSMLGNRVASTILAAFAAIALLLAALGIYGVVAYTAAQRTREMGVRAALGASAGSLRGLIAWGGLRLALVGLVVGLVGTLMTTRVLSSMLYGVAIDDTATIAIAGGTLATVAVLACVVPAWRTTKAGPMDALRWRA